MKPPRNRYRPVVTPPSNPLLLVIYLALFALSAFGIGLVLVDASRLFN